MKISVAVIGCGLVGRELISQFASSSLFKNDLKVVAIANSKKMIHDPDLKTWQEDLQGPGALQLKYDAIILKLKDPLYKAHIIVECTSSQEVAALYPSWLRSGINIITPNKKGVSGEMELYDEIREASMKCSVSLLYESTVCAGLPIICTINDIIRTGDQITSIEGIFSGTLSYIFNNMGCNGKRFSSILKDAKERGYTEPDPRDDLSGMDFARKVVILGRLIGLNLSLSDIKYPKILFPDSLTDTSVSVDKFMNSLDESDKHWDKMIEQANMEGYTMRYVGIVNSKGCSMEIKKFSKSHPFSNITNCNNIVSIKTKRFEDPIIITGPGAGAGVTAFGVFSDLLRLCNHYGVIMSN